jgi:protein JBTS26
MEAKPKRRIRPTTTGEIAFAMKDPSLSNPHIDSGSKVGVRPRAPLPTRRAEEVATKSSVGRRDSEIAGDKTARKSSITEVWALNRGSRTEFSRDEAAGEDNTTIHFLNIESKDPPSAADDIKIIRSGTEPLFTSSSRRKHLGSLPTTNIPNLPKGRILSINILSNYGDPSYVGLMGVEVFDDSGQIVSISRIWTDQNDSVVESSIGLHSIDKLLDGHNVTCDDLHSWMAPFTTGGRCIIYMQFDSLSTVSMIRIWNYNKSRIHSLRGVRYVELNLDRQAIFQGEIRKAPGTLSLSEITSCSECILFTNSLDILALIEKHDPSARYFKTEDKRIKHKADAKNHLQNQLLSYDRDKKLSKSDKNIDAIVLGGSRSVPTFESEAIGLGHKGREYLRVSAMNCDLSKRPSTAMVMQNQRSTLCSRVDIYVISNWGDENFVGLTGICGMDDAMDQFELTVPKVTISSIVQSKDELACGDSRKIVNGFNLTVDESQMWTFCDVNGLNSKEGYLVMLRFDLNFRVPLKGLKIWNYNGGGEDGLCYGIKHCRIVLNNKIEISTRVVRKATGDESFEYGQYIPFVTGEHKESSSFIDAWSYSNETEKSSEKTAQEEHIDFNSSPAIRLCRQEFRGTVCEVSQQYVTPCHPNGCIIKIEINSTWGDQYYLGLNGLALFDENGEQIILDSHQLQALPLRDINSLREIRERGHDERCLENLIDPNNDTFNDKYMWLCPVSLESTSSYGLTSVLILFDEPITLSCIKLWNYSKTPGRGAKDIKVS